MMSKILKQESGAALLITLGALAIVTILGAAAITVAGGSLNLTSWDRSTHQAFNVAEAGFDQAVSRARSETLDADFDAKLENGEVQVSVTNIAKFVFLVKSVGAVPNFSDPKATRAIEGKVVAITPYNVFFADAAGGVIQGSTTIDGPLYVRDYLEFSGTGGIIGGPLFIKDNPATSDYTGDLALLGSSNMGTAAEPIYAFIDGTYPAENVEFHAIDVFSDVPEVNMPVISDSLKDMKEQRGLADLVIDDDGLTNGSFSLDFDQDLPAGTYGSYPAGPYIEWETPPGKKRIIRIKGTIFVDGPVSMGSNKISQITYTGKGTIIANGPIAISSEFRPVVESEFPNTTVFGFLTGSQIDIDPKSGDFVYALLYARERINFVNQIEFYGSALTDVLDVSNNPHLHISADLSSWDLPPGMPRVEGAVVVTEWREVAP